jgi:energy-coupling factor transporter ATP-binding protein EcfA2
MGLALAVFDEAFNRLDSKAICDCSDFIRSLGLQIVLATPDEKRHVFMEVADTIVNVNRSGNEVLVHTEYLTEKTRTSLSEIDPYRKGFDAFKAEMIAASATAAEQPVERGEAAE